MEMPAASDNDIYQRIIRRVTWLIAGFGCAGSAIVSLRWGWKAGTGFLLGAALSYLSFWRWRKIAEALGHAPRPHASALMILRFLLLIALTYGIIKYLDVPPAAVLTGLLAAGAAVFVALILELV